jgi:hypothetical protein
MEEFLNVNKITKPGIFCTQYVNKITKPGIFGTQ